MKFGQNKKHILVIAQYFFPEQFRINDIASEWVERGYKVTVVTGIPNYPTGKYFPGYGVFRRRRENYNGVDIIRIPLIPRGKNTIMLALNYVSFVISGFFWSFFTRLKADFVFIFETSPMTQALPGIWYSKRKKIPCYLYVQDLWPENVEIITGISNPIIMKPIGKMVDYIYRGCSRIFTTSQSFVESIHKRGVPYEKLEFWPQYAEDFYDKKTFKNMDKFIDKEKFNIIFAGNIGEAQGLNVLPDCAVKLKNIDMQDKICINIIGDGRYKERLIHEIKIKDLDDMFNFIERQPAEYIPDFMAYGDVSLITLSDDPLFEMTIPAKLQSYMACGKPILAAVNGETKRIIMESGSGICVNTGDSEGLFKAVKSLFEMEKRELEIMGKNSKQYYEDNYKKKMLMDRMEKYFTPDIIIK